MQSNRISVTCLLGLVALVSLACALPAPADRGEAPGTPDPTPIVADAEPWAPSEEWLDLYQRDAEVRDLLAQSLNEPDRDAQLDLYYQYREQRTALEDYLVQNPDADADAPCATLVRYAPPEMWCDAEDADFESLT